MSEEEERVYLQQTEGVELPERFRIEEAIERGSVSPFPWASGNPEADVEFWEWAYALVDDFSDPFCETREGLDPDVGTLRCEQVTEVDGSVWPIFTFTGTVMVARSDHDDPNGYFALNEPDSTFIALPSGPYGVAVNIKDSSIAKIQDLQAGGINVFPNMAYFPQQWINFRPEKGPGTGPGWTPQPITTGNNSAQVITIDTGHIAGSGTYRVDPLLKNFDNEDILAKSPTAPTDAVAGHGPAIADLIGKLVHANSADQDSWLQRVAYSESDPAGLISAHASGNFRAFDTYALAASLHALDELVQGGDSLVINLSLSGPGTFSVLAPASGSLDPVASWIQNASTNPGLRIAAAAGNEPTAQPQFPAAWSSHAVGSSHVVSVGSCDPNRTAISGFSNYGRWVDAFLPGESVMLTHPLSGAVTWTGTSFATPQAAALLAAGLTKHEIRSSYPRP